jgi:hypothetical protein
MEGVNAYEKLDSVPDPRWLLSWAEASLEGELIEGQRDPEGKTPYRLSAL